MKFLRLVTALAVGCSAGTALDPSAGTAPGCIAGTAPGSISTTAGGAVPELPWEPTPSAADAYARAAAIASLGRKMFFDPNLSASGRIACATCHDPAHAFAAPDAMPIRMGGPNLRLPGIRAVPNLTYGTFAPAFSEHFFEPEDDGDESVDQGPTGGLDWDGRIDRTRDQVRIPLLDNNEMANPNVYTVAASIARAQYAPEVRRMFGQEVFANPERVFAAVTEALEFYQQTPSTFAPFSSKFDSFLLGRATLTASEARGLAAFNNPDKGNCAQCHKGGVTADGRPPLFTDFGYAALGVPRNPAIPANNDPAYFDLGLCGPKRKDLTAQAKYCGMFKAPTLRNVAAKQSFYHNGVFRSLRDAVAFYASRDTEPAKWYPPGPDGTARKFDDLPAEYATNVTMELPFGGKQILSDADVDDIVAFLRTLTDGYRPEPSP